VPATAGAKRDASLRSPTASRLSMTREEEVAGETPALRR